MAVFKYSDSDYYETMTSEPLKFARELAVESGLEMGTILMGDDPAESPAVMMLELPPGYTLPRHGHGTYRVEIVVRGSLTLSDGRVLTAGDVWSSGPEEFYGPHTAGPEGVLTAEIFSSSAGLAPMADPDSDEDAINMATEIGARTREAQGL